jgi:hypothetical protein
MNERIPIDKATLSDLMSRPIIVRIVTILDITSLSILELFEYGLTINDINFSMANGVIAYDKAAKRVINEETALGIPLSGDYYYNFLSSKVKLTELGLYILDTIKSNQTELKSSVPDEQISSDADPRHPSTISWHGWNLGIVFGAIGIGFLEDLSGLNITIQLAGFLAVASRIFVLGVMKETKDKDFQIVFFKQN